MCVFLCSSSPLVTSRFRGIAPDSTLPARVAENRIEPLHPYGDRGGLDWVSSSGGGGHLAKEVLRKFNKNIAVLNDVLCWLGVGVPARSPFWGGGLIHLENAPGDQKKGPGEHSFTSLHHLLRSLAPHSSSLQTMAGEVHNNKRCTPLSALPISWGPILVGITLNLTCK